MKIMSMKLAEILAGNNKNLRENIDYIRYGIEIVLMSIIGVTGMIIISLVMNNKWGWISFLISFALLRSSAGGYHAKSAITTMRKVFIFWGIMVCCMIFIFCGCASKEIEKTPLEYCFSLKQCYEEKYDNITLRNDIQIESKKTIFHKKYMIKNMAIHNRNCYESAFQNILGKKVNKDFVDTTSFFPKGYYYDDGEVYIGLGENGFFSYEKGGQLPDYHSNSETSIIETYDLYGTYQNDELEVSDGTITVDEAAEKMQSKVDELEKYLGYEQEVKVSRIIYVDAGDASSNYIGGILQIEKDGILLSSITNIREQNENVRVPYLGTFSSMDTIDEITEVTLYDTGILEEYDEGYEIENMVSAETAVSLLSELLSKECRYEIKDVRLEYGVRKLYNDYEKNPDKYKNANFSKEDNSGVYDVYDVYPCWAIIIDDNFEKEIMAYVNCESGEVEFICNQF